MLQILADEDFNSRIVRGLLRLLPELDLVRAQDIEMKSASDTKLLEAAAKEGRILLTHDAKTMPIYAYDRVKTGQPMPGLVVCSQGISIGSAIADIALLAECSETFEWENRVVYLPL